MLPGSASAAFLMCAPRFFDVQYVINPWMEVNVHSASRSLAGEQWARLHAAVSAHARVELVDPQPGLPDMVFTANAGLIQDGLTRDGQAVLSRFRCPERQGEEPFFEAWFEGAGLPVLTPPADMPFEGEGDALFTADRTRLWAGHGWRTSLASHALLAEAFGCEVISLRLVDPCFYHLDTCFCPLANGDLLYYPAAFDPASRALIEAYYPAPNRIAVSAEDAQTFACNAVNIGRTVILNRISPALCGEMERRGFSVIQVELSEFLKAGGAAKCLVLRVA